MINGLAVIVRNEAEYKRIQELLTKDVLYIDWQPQMATTETAIIMYSEHGDYSTGSVGATEYHKQDNIRTVEFSEFFKLNP